MSTNKKKHGHAGEAHEHTSARKKGARKSDREELFDALLEVAITVQKNAYAPYSNYKVGAAIVSSNGTVFGGCNVENASLGATICAERSALMQMVAAGESGPLACVIVTAGDEPAAPCGMCRQFMAEFADDMVIWSTNLNKDRVIVEHSLAALLPGAFNPGFLERARTAKLKVSKKK
jgi:cytidine deaminase